MQSDVSHSLLRLRALDAERALVRETVAAYRDTLHLTERRYQAGDVAELDLARVAAEVASTESQALALDRRRAELEHALAVLVGEPACSFGARRGRLAGAPPQCPPGVPSTVLARRPDVSAAQRAMLAAQARVGVAQTAWFPDVSLTAPAAIASTDLGDLLKWSARSLGHRRLAVAAAVRRRPARGRRAERATRSGTPPRQPIASRCWSPSRTSRTSSPPCACWREQADAQAEAVDAAARATVLSDSRYRNGYVSQLELLDARRSELSNRRASAAGARRAVPGDGRPDPRARGRLDDELTQRHSRTSAAPVLTNEWCGRARPSA